MKSSIHAGAAMSFIATLAFADAALAAGATHNTGAAAKDVHITATGASGYAVVDADGTLSRKLNAKTVTPDDVGSYIVNFNSNIRSCAYTATVGLSGSSGTSAPGYATVVGSIASVKGVYVQTFDSSGNQANLGFHLLVSC